ncbi:hypothetical protein [Aliiglaciecola litoralis]|uniref:Uncharacterized protein n=1 Tax=Aliiglaciecola litoralis TaxID=582857 RepID=A0ABP3WQ64_9ALTE
MKNLFFRWGSNPHKSWADFKIGLGIFVLGVVLIYVGLQFWIFLQIPAVILLAVGFLIAAKGYLGIFANRFSQTLNRLGGAAERDKQNKR